MEAELERRISQYVAIRDKRDEIREEQKSVIKKYDEVLEQLETFLLGHFNNNGVESLRTKAGTAFVKTEVSATIADAAAFRRHVIGTESWDLVDWRANKTKVREQVEELAEAPPGVNYSTRRIVQVRRPSHNGE